MPFKPLDPDSPLARLDTAALLPIAERLRKQGFVRAETLIQSLARNHAGALAGEREFRKSSEVFWRLLRDGAVGGSPQAVVTVCVDYQLDLSSLTAFIEHIAMHRLRPKARPVLRHLILLRSLVQEDLAQEVYGVLGLGDLPKALRAAPGEPRAKKTGTAKRTGRPRTKRLDAMARMVGFLENGGTVEALLSMQGKDLGPRFGGHARGTACAARDELLEHLASKSGPRVSDN